MEKRIFVIRQNFNSVILVSHFLSLFKIPSIMTSKVELMCKSIMNRGLGFGKIFLRNDTLLRK